MFPLRYRMVTAGVGEDAAILQVRTACARRCSVKLRVKEVHMSTSVMGVFSIDPVIEVGRAALFEGCS